jgi:hypothetical protein
MVTVVWRGISVTWPPWAQRMVAFVVTIGGMSSVFRPARRSAKVPLGCLTLPAESGMVGAEGLAVGEDRV